ncbi:MAG TPA: hypothetical protein VES64_00440 [Allosphingosinicella sp.]|nr:hypothetical protein [Allosphingosinicella sp.]
MEAGIERLTALVFVITGLSHVAAPRAWARFFIDMREKGEVAGFHNAFVHIPLGLLILAFHPVWSGAGLLVTLIGCGLTLKGTIYFLWPSLALRTMAHVSEASAWKFRVAGVPAVALGVLIGWIASGRPAL